MALYAIPAVFMIEADTLEEAREHVIDWQEEVGVDGMPVGTETFEYDIKTEIDEEGHRIARIPPHEDEDILDLDELAEDEADDYNDGDHEEF